MGDYMKRDLLLKKKYDDMSSQHHAMNPNVLQKWVQRQAQLLKSRNLSAACRVQDIKTILFIGAFVGGK